MKINFYPDSNNENFELASKQYKAIWDAEGDLIVETLEGMSGLSFVEKKINAIIFEGMSHSHPLMLRASYNIEVKKATLIHELGHRLLSGNNIRSENSLDAHKQLFLILYGVWEQLYGKDYADEMVKVESARTKMYKEAWDWAMGFNEKLRAELFESVK